MIPTDFGRRSGRGATTFARPDATTRDRANFLRPSLVDRIAEVGVLPGLDPGGAPDLGTLQPDDFLEEAVSDRHQPGSLHRQELRLSGRSQPLVRPEQAVRLSRWARVSQCLGSSRITDRDVNWDLSDQVGEFAVREDARASSLVHVEVPERQGAGTWSCGHRQVQRSPTDRSRRHEPGAETVACDGFQPRNPGVVGDERIERSPAALGLPAGGAA